MKQLKEFVATGQAAQAAVDQAVRKPGATRGAKFRESRRKIGFVYVAIWVHGEDAESVRTYARRKNAARFRGKTAAGRVPSQAALTR